MTRSGGVLEGATRTVTTVMLSVHVYTGRGRKSTTDSFYQFPKMTLPAQCFFFTAAFNTAAWPGG